MPKTNLTDDTALISKVFRTVKSPQAVSDLLKDLLTEEEIIDLAQRLKIAKLIISGKNYDEISKSVDTSTATISKIGQAIKYGNHGFTKVFKAKSK